MVSEDLIDELGAIEAIYPECFNRLNDALIDLKVPQHEEYTIRISFPELYPKSEPPHILQVRSTNINDDNQYLENLFNEVLEYVYNKEAVCIFDFLTELDGILFVEEDQSSNLPQGVAEPVKIDHFEGWTISDPVIDRQSTFIAFVRKVDNEDELYEKLNTLRSEKKIAKATHNMVAFRIRNQNGTRLSDCDDDGETAAGGRLLHLLTLMDVWNCIVVVSRWYGGIHLGPDRFKHINSTAREAIIAAGLYEEPTNKSSKKKKK
ncbi:hypothetical protein WICMUC_001070 [Wickerhamomyces mucosus]|uniref:RWD domain-containing protein n=1 Tax=Wickerhamomyces mucosus TaxID=1378264 RepID=A0A9P8PXC2_9ASCO|nr:hypothetical protein WICMUC_001070 [Wickerhamomyces mucosus]